MYFDSIACGLRIRALRQLHGMTQEQFADRLHVSPDHLGKVEIGKRRCSLDLLIEIAEEFHISLDYLLLGRERPNMAAKEKIHSIIGALVVLEREL